MLFSNEELASFINEKFEPVWVSLRPVPRVTIDFGNGNVVKRTLHGNIATWICTSDGTAIDALPGIYEAETYQTELAKLVRVHKALLSICKQRPVDFLKNYHSDEIEAAENSDVTQFQVSTSAGNSAIKGLSEDTQYNETKRRVVIHERLREIGISTPGDSTHWLYREILNADLDDPYMGLGEKLFKDYPFAEEDAN